MPDDLRDSVQYENIITDLIKKAGDKIKSNADARKKYRETNPGGTITKQQHLQRIRNSGGDPSHWANSYEPEGEMVEANSAQQKAMQDAKMKKMEDDKVAAKKKKMDEACWKGYEKKGMKTMFGKRYPNCVKKTKKEEVQLEAKKSCGEGEYYCHDRKKCMPVPKGAKVGKDGMLVKEGHKNPKSVKGIAKELDKAVEMHKSQAKRLRAANVSEDMKGMSQKSGDKRSTESGAGMTAKGVAKYNRRTGGNLKTAVTTPPSKLKAGSKAAKRRKSFCARSKSWTGPRGKAARRRWNCSYEPELPMIIDEKKKLYNGAPLSDRVAAWTNKINEGDTYVKTDRNKFGLPKDLKSVEKKVEKKPTGVNYGAMAQSYVPQGDVIQEMGRKGKGAINTDVLKNNPNLDPTKPGDYIRLKRLSAKVDKINERKMTSSEKDKKEKYVKGMKKDKGGFTKRYGKDGKSVMYATATKMAMRKEGMGTIAGTAAAITLGGMGLNAIRNQLQNKKKMEQGGKFKSGSMMDNIQKRNQMLQQMSYEPQGEMIEAKVDQGKDEASKINTRNQRTFGNRRGQKGGMHSGEDMEKRRYNTKAGRGVKLRGQKDKRPMNYHKRDSDARLKSTFKDMGISTKSFDKTKREKDKLPYRTEEFYRKKYTVKDGYKKTNKMTKSNKRSGDSKAQYRDLHKDLAKIKEGSLHKWFSGSKSKDGKGGWVNVVTGGTCASDKPGEGTPKCVSSSKRASMTKAERLSASRRKKKADPGQQSKSGAAKPTYVSTDKKKKTNESLTALSAVGLTMAALQKRKNDQLNYKPGTGRKVDTAGTVANVLRNKGKLVTNDKN